MSLIIGNVPDHLYLAHIPVLLLNYRQCTRSPITPHPLILILILSVPCPATYEAGPNGHCYWFSYSYSYGNMWHWGRQDCMAQPDSDLVIIDDEEELAFLQNRITEINETRDWWIGKYCYSLYLMIILAAFIMHTFPSSTCSKCNILLLPRSLDTISEPHLQHTISTAIGAFLAKLPIMTLQANTLLLNISFTSYRISIHTPGSRAAMWINCLAE